ncbi:sodium-dependent glucose transporter 1 [Platysternon megacephalum]|uniref:Sodium-dependent glucose transporter 1 n=1 Tax=Platysternon megacephalum TaxID=55544 RepID=A0A4D9F4Y4_9SAUR|nr:sodium-dependent glucose transporter 1 [Platysternon megacephalum]
MIINVTKKADPLEIGAETTGTESVLLDLLGPPACDQLLVLFPSCIFRIPNFNGTLKFSGNLLSHFVPLKTMSHIHCVPGRTAALQVTWIAAITWTGSQGWVNHVGWEHREAPGQEGPKMT